MSVSALAIMHKSSIQSLKQAHPDSTLEPHVSLRHGAQTSLLRGICSRYSLNKCDAWVTAAPARIAAATMAASVSIVSFAPA